jgi:hypothetical protein
MDNVFRDNAPFYWGANLPVMPLKIRSKAPILGEWTQYAVHMPSAAVRELWLRDYPRSNLGLPFGPASGLCAIDIDTTDEALVQAIMDCLPESPWVRIGAKGCAMVYRWQGQRNSASSSARATSWCCRRRSTRIPVSPTRRTPTCGK